MKNITAKSILPNSWILYDGATKIGLMSFDKKWNFISTSGSNTYDSLEFLCDAENFVISFEEVDIVEESIEDIDGLPVTAKPFNIENTPIVSFTKNARSKVRYAAGYWGINFANGWTPSLCPKKDTLDAHDHIGPFSTKIEMNTIISQQKRKK